MIDLNKHKLELNYPCKWTYKVVVKNEVNVKKLISKIISKRKHEIKESKVSSKGKYKSYSLELLVHSDDDRKEIYSLLGDEDNIKMVL